MARPSAETVGKAIRHNLLLLLMILAMAIGIGMGWGLRFVEPKLTERDIFYLRFPGDLLLQMLKMLILPLIVSSLVSGMASLDLKQSGRIGLRAIVYYLTTTLFAVIMGIILVVSIQPGTRGNKEDITKAGSAKIVNTADALLDLLRVSFPDNLIEACFQRKITDQIPVEKEEATTDAPMNMTQNMTMNVTEMMTTTMMTMMNASNETNTTMPPEDDEPIEYLPKVVAKPGMNVLGLVVFSIFFGCIISRMEEKGKILADFFEALNQATMQLITLVIWYSPIGVLFLIAAKMVEMKDPEVVFSQLGLYCVTVIVGLIIHGYIILPIIYFIATRKNPYRFIYGMVQAIVTALATASSSATLPVTMNCLEHNNKVDVRIAKFIAPIGATINMDGTALYEAVASIFIAQINGIALSLGQIITVSVTATAAAIGAAGVPQAGLVTMVIVLTAVGLPTEDVTVILAVDWFLDRCRTSVNVLGDALGAGIVHGLSEKELRNMDAKEREENGDMEKMDFANGAYGHDGYANGNVSKQALENSAYNDDENTKL